MSTPDKKKEKKGACRKLKSNRAGKDNGQDKDKDNNEGEEGSAAEPCSKLRPVVEVEKVPQDFRRALFKFAVGTMTRGTKALKDDFVAQPRKQLDPEKTRHFHANNPKGKNRYKDVGCLDAHRVKLKDYGDNDYIHANYVKTPTSDKRFICTQAPVEATIADFWHMVLQEGCQNIIMLVSMAEKGMKKWTEYFPTEKGEQIMFGDYAVSCMGQKTVRFKTKTPTEICETALRVEHDGKSLKLKHYHWVDWPDRGVPPADMAVVELLQKACSTEAPVIVHCSAGVGRTGVVVMIQYVLEMVQQGQAFESLAPILKEIRSQRGNSIQTQDQYFFIHMVLLKYFFQIDLLDSQSGGAYLEKFTQDYKKNTIIDVPKDKK